MLAEFIDRDILFTHFIYFIFISNIISSSIHSIQDIFKSEGLNNKKLMFHNQIDNTQYSKKDKFLNIIIPYLLESYHFSPPKMYVGVHHL